MVPIANAREGHGVVHDRILARRCPDECDHANVLEAFWMAWVLQVPGLDNHSLGDHRVPCGKGRSFQAEIRGKTQVQTSLSKSKLAISGFGRFRSILGNRWIYELGECPDGERLS